MVFFCVYVCAAQEEISSKPNHLVSFKAANRPERHRSYLARSDSDDDDESVELIQIKIVVVCCVYGLFFSNVRRLAKIFITKINKAEAQALDHSLI